MRILVTKLMSWVWFPGPTWWKEKTDAKKWTSDLHIHVVARKCTNTHVRVHTHTHTHMGAHTRVHTHALTHMCTHAHNARTHMLTHAHIHRCTRARTRTHTKCNFNFLK